MKMDPIQQKIEDTLGVLDHIQAADAPVDLWEKTLVRIRQRREKRLPLPVIWLVAASFALLFALNVAYWSGTLESGIAKELQAANLVAATYLNQDTTQ
jgi:type VI protein secretion system component VasF